MKKIKKINLHGYGYNLLDIVDAIQELEKKINEIIEKLKDIEGNKYE